MYSLVRTCVCSQIPWPVSIYCIGVLTSLLVAMKASLCPGRCRDVTLFFNIVLLIQTISGDFESNDICCEVLWCLIDSILVVKGSTDFFTKQLVFSVWSCWPDINFAWIFTERLVFSVLSCTTDIKTLHEYLRKSFFSVSCGPVWLTWTMHEYL